MDLEVAKINNNKKVDLTAQNMSRTPAGFSSRDISKGEIDNTNIAPTGMGDY